MKEVRCIEMRADTEQDGMVVEGYAVVFDQVTNLGYYNEVIDRNAFEGADLSDISFKYNHEGSTLPLARTRGGSLRFEIDERGMKITAKFIDNEWSRSVYSLIKNGVLDKMSFAFTVKEEEYDYETDTRRILAFDKIFEVSVVEIPAYDSTEIYARSKEQYEQDKKDYEARKELELEKAKIIAKLSLED